MTSTRTLAVIGASGGVGASVLAAAMAVRAGQAGRSSVCVDGDRFGGGLDVTFGLEQQPGLRWPDLGGVRGRVDGPALLQRLPSTQWTSVLSYDRQRDVELPMPAITDVLAGLTGGADVVVVDLPRSESPMFDALTSSLQSVVLVAGDSVRSLAAAGVLAPRLSAVCPDVWLCLRGVGRPAFVHSVSDALDLPVIASLRDDRRVGADLQHGVPPGAGGRGPLREAADLVLAQLLLGSGQVAS